MKVVIVGRDQETLSPLVDKLSGEGFEVLVVDGVSGVQSYIKNASLHFLLADANLLLDRGLAREVLKRCPLARLIVLASQPSLLGMSDALAGGLADYFPRFPEYFDDVVATLVVESRRLHRWQRWLLSGRDLLAARRGAAAAPPEAEPGDPANEEETGE